MRALLLERTHALLSLSVAADAAKLARGHRGHDRNVNPSKIIMAAKRPDLRR